MKKRKKKYKQLDFFHLVPAGGATNPKPVTVLLSGEEAYTPAEFRRRSKAQRKKPGREGEKGS